MPVVESCAKQAGQFGKALGGCKVIGIAGGADKCDWLTRELGFDHAIDYKQYRWQQRLRDAYPSDLAIASAFALTLGRTSSRLSRI